MIETLIFLASLLRSLLWKHISVHHSTRSMILTITQSQLLLERTTCSTLLSALTHLKLPDLKSNLGSNSLSLHPVWVKRWKAYLILWMLSLLSLQTFTSALRQPNLTEKTFKLLSNEFKIKIPRFSGHTLIHGKMLGNRLMNLNTKIYLEQLDMYSVQHWSKLLADPSLHLTRMVASCLISSQTFFHQSLSLRQALLRLTSQLESFTASHKERNLINSASASMVAMSLYMIC